MLVCVFMGGVGSILKYLVRRSFWGFCAASFFTGLFGATVAVSMAYASDVAKTRLEKDGAIGKLIGISLVGATGGGLVSTALNGVGLFEPLCHTEFPTKTPDIGLYSHFNPLTSSLPRHLPLFHTSPSFHSPWAPSIRPYIYLLSRMRSRS